MRYYTDDPVRDFERYDADREDELANLPVCDICDEPIQDEHYYIINGDNICPLCLEACFRVRNDY